MNFDQYQNLALVTSGTHANKKEAIGIWTLGVAGEAGEVAELVKKHLGHGHELKKEQLVKELGDVLWYLAVLSAELGISFSDVAIANIEKLRDRYPEGFSHEASIGRRE